MDQIIISLFTSLGLDDFYAVLSGSLALGISLFAASVVINFLTQKILLSAVKKIVKKTATTWDDILVEQGLFTRLAHTVPGLIIYYTLPLVFQRYSSAIVFIQPLVQSYLILVVFSVISSFISGVNIIYSSFEISKNRPIKGYLQIVRGMISIMAVILVFATILNKSAMGLISGIGALSAVLMLIFKDSLLGLVASIQLSGNDMVRIGDWISMPENGADGDVVDINLQTVTIQNFDKTLVSVPIYSLISSSFKNWRGMSESGGRRIKRHINIDMNSVKFCSDELLEKLCGIDILGDYINSKMNEIKNDNSRKIINPDLLINGRHLTNIGLFRAYLAQFLKAHPSISDSMTFLIRQLQPTDKGIPLEIYVFSNDQVWANYESLQSDIFDHILASISYFDLAVYQTPSSLDFRRSFNRESYSLS